MSFDLNTIVVGYDGFDRDEPLPSLAVALAKEHTAKLHVVNVMPPLPKKVWESAEFSPQELHASLVHTRKERIAELLADAGASDLESHVEVSDGSAAASLIAYVDKVHADLLLISDEPQNREGTLGFGTVTTQLMRECPAPVLATRDQSTKSHSRILAAIDAEANPEDPHPNEEVLEAALSLARRCGGEVVAFHAWSMWGEQMLRSGGRTRQEELDTLLTKTKQARLDEINRLLQSANIEGVNITTELAKGDARFLLPAYVSERGIDLVVMGTVCRTGLPGMLIGNTAEKILNQLKCSVLAIKPKGFSPSNK